MSEEITDQVHGIKEKGAKKPLALPAPKQMVGIGGNMVWV